jgi:hypothetical protein
VTRKRKSRRKAWRRRLPWRKIKPNRSYLEEYEEKVILVHMYEVAANFPDGLRLAAADLIRDKPERYDQRELVKALKRMSKKGLVARGRRGPFGMSYALKEERREAA